jgi:hypothetical protein
VPYEWLYAALAVIARREIEPHEVLQVLYGRLRRPVPVRSPEGLALLNVCGRTAAGRPLVVTVRPVRGLDAVIVGAREMSAKEREEFEAWELSR